MDEGGAYVILTRYTANLGSSERSALLRETSVTRTVAGQSVTYYDPYAAALAHLMHPDTVKARTEGQVSETYLDPAQLIGYLKGRSAETQAAWPKDDALSTLTPNLTLDIQGWN